MSKEKVSFPALERMTGSRRSKSVQDAPKDIEKTPIQSSPSTDIPTGVESIRIEKGIPLPAALGIPLHQMEVGDSFLLPSNTGAVNVRQSIRAWKQDNPQFSEWVFTVRYDETRRYRCWRIK